MGDKNKVGDGKESDLTKAADEILKSNVCEDPCDEKCFGQCMDAVYNMIHTHTNELREMEEMKVAHTPRRRGTRRWRWSS